MARVHGMDLNKKTAIMVASAEPIRGLLREIVEETGTRTRYLAGRVSAQAVVNGLVLWLGSRGDEERARIVDESLRMIGAIEQDLMTVDQLIGGGPTSVEAPTSVAIPTRTPTGRVLDPGGEDSAVVEKHRGPARKK